MATYLLDTNHASKLLSSGHPLWNKIQSAVAAGSDFLLPLGVIEEMQFGLEKQSSPALICKNLFAIMEAINVGTISCRHGYGKGASNGVHERDS
jgi:predicted nucleic acid-binding protein